MFTIIENHLLHLTVSEIHGQVIAAIDINTVANTVYEHNHRSTQLLNRNIQNLTPKFIETLNVNTIFMSPPCQPFTRVGKQQDVGDARTDALIHLCEIIPDLSNVTAILMENVKGFETSQARDLYVEALRKAGYHYQEFILSPSQLYIPNTRHRYYCLARKLQPFAFSDPELLKTFPVCTTAQEHLPQFGCHVLDYIDVDSEYTQKALLPNKVLEKRANLLDIVGPDATNTICFTKAYTHYTEGTGSVYCPQVERVAEVFENAKLQDDVQERLSNIKTLQMRYFTPNEVAKLMCFPVNDSSESFSFPPKTTTKQKYRLLGNSINVYVVSELIRLLFDEIND